MDSQGKSLSLAGPESESQESPGVAVTGTHRKVTEDTQARFHRLDTVTVEMGTPAAHGFELRLEDSHSESECPSTS